MGSGRKAQVVSGFDIVRSIRRSESSTAPPAPMGSVAASGGTVALPPRRVTACPLCGWATEVAGRPTFGVCPRCRQKFDIVDYTLDVEFDGRIVTGGRVRVGPDGVVRGGEISAAEVEVQGRIAGGRVCAKHRLVLRAGAMCAAGCVEFGALTVERGIELTFPAVVRCRAVDLAGVMEAELEAEEGVILREGAVFRGRLKCASLCVEDGAALLAAVEAGRRPRAG
ncbi:MAG: polymer-forming cytoskeletal protein [Kiritimatiellae bacterium]|nr:polymer-forming cytoskeletal protein [Kiritimatiellia bacterium]